MTLLPTLAVTMLGMWESPDGRVRQSFSRSRCRRDRQSVVILLNAARTDDGLVLGEGGGERGNGEFVDGAGVASPATGAASRLRGAGRPPASALPSIARRRPRPWAAPARVVPQRCDERVLRAAGGKPLASLQRASVDPPANTSVHLRSGAKRNPPRREGLELGRDLPSAYPAGAHRGGLPPGRQASLRLGESRVRRRCAGGHGSGTMGEVVV